MFFANGVTILTLVLFVMLLLVIASVGVVIVILVSNKKWGYTKKRERELEKIGEEKPDSPKKM